ncbi:flagellar biosynthesis protein FlhF [Candidatus Woesearchaeota archaeon]|nr:flagellar biosynthesis protein FlhF [Candidatus Woesearchaeota archaeon]
MSVDRGSDIRRSGYSPGRFSPPNPTSSTDRSGQSVIAGEQQEALVSSAGGGRYRPNTASRRSGGLAADRLNDGVRFSVEDARIERNGLVDNPSRPRRSDADPDFGHAAAKTANRPTPLGQAQSIVESRSQYPQEGQDQFVRVIQQELRLMRNMLDGHLGETGWQQVANRSPLRMELLRRFSTMGFSRQLTLDLTRQVSNSIDVETAIEDAGELLGKLLPLAQEDLLETGGIVALVGPTGVGKTTTIAKLAARFRMKHGPREIALITTDNYRIAAYEQLTTYGRILDVPVRIASGLDELHQHLDTFYDRKLVLIDTAGMGPRDLRLMEQINLFSKVSIPIKSCLVISAASQLRTMQEAMDAFRGFSPEACILTKIDEAAQAGASLSAVIENRLPVAFVCDGQQVPEDLHHARKGMILDWCLSDDETRDTDANRPFSYEDWIIQANV